MRRRAAIRGEVGNIVIIERTGLVSGAMQGKVGFRDGLTGPDSRRYSKHGKYGKP